MRYYLTERSRGALYVVAETIGGTDPIDGSPFPHLAGAEGSTRGQLLDEPAAAKPSGDGSGATTRRGKPATTRTA